MSCDIEVVLGYEKGKLDSIESYYIMVAELKNTRHKLMTNFCMNSQQLKEAILRNEVEYEYKHGKYLNLVIADDGFSRLYYYVIEAKDYHFGGKSNTFVCDIFFMEEDKDIDKVIMALCHEGFSQYKSYHKVILKNPKIVNVEKNNDVEIIQGIDKNTIELMYQYFDKFSDYLPRKFELEKFVCSKKFLSLYDIKSHELLGGLIYTEKNHSVIEEFLFVKEKAQGRKLSNFLHFFWYEILAGSDVKFTAWIRDDNIPSIALHSRYNYQYAKIVKITYLKK